MGLRGWMDEWMNVVQLLLKIPRLETSVFYSFSPNPSISKLPFLSKILEKDVLSQLQIFLDTNGIYMVF